MSFAEAVLVLLVVGLAIWNRTLRRDKELLSEQLRGVRDKGNERKPELIGAQPERAVAEVPRIETELFCPNCKSSLTEVDQKSRKGDGVVCPACNHSWSVSNQPRYRPVVPSINDPNRGWTFADQKTSCPDCGSGEFEMRTYGGPLEYADTHCAKCGKLIRRFDAA
jgi:predicted Zn finger-like uncharacterized protein